MLGRLVAMLFVGVTATIAFQLLEVPAPLLLGVFAGLMAFIEYAGAVISAVPPVLLAFAQSPIRGLWVPSVHFPPALALAGQVVFGVLLGPLGLTFSTPLLVLIVSAASAWRTGPSPALD